MTETDIERALTDALKSHAAGVTVRPDLDGVIAERQGAVSVLRAAGRPHRRMKRTAVIAAAAVVVVAALTVIMSGRLGPKDEVQSVLAGNADLIDGMGQWTALAPGPAGAASGLTHGSELSDGRLLFWGIDASWSPGATPVVVTGENPAGVPGFEDPPGPRASSVAVAIYAPRDDTWLAVDTDAMAPMELAGGNAVKMSGDRLLIVGASLDGTNQVTMYDAAIDRWTTSIVPGTNWEAFDGVAWDGETAVLVRLFPDVGDEPVPDWVGVRPSGRDPKVWRWTAEDDRWADGEPPPLAPRAFSGWAFDGERLAVVGGCDAADIEATTGAQASGAVYDIDADSWSKLPDALWPAMHPELAWDGDHLLYAGGTLGSEVSEKTVVRRQATWSSSAGWQELPAPEDEPSMWKTVRLTDPLDGAAPDRSGMAILATNEEGVPDSEGLGSVLVEGAWEQLPLSKSMTLRNRRWFVATTTTVGGAADLFEVVVRAAAGQWVTAAPAPFSDVWRPALVLVGDRLYVVGTQRESLLRRGPAVSGAWVLDLKP